MHDKTEAGAAKLFVCLQDNRETMVWDDSWVPLMEEMTELLGITDWDSYVWIKTKYNLTQYWRGERVHICFLVCCLIG